MTSPLQNKLFVSTRPAGASDELKSLFNEAGATLLELPLIEIKAAKLAFHEQILLARLEDFDWMILTSANGVKYLFEKLEQITGSKSLPEKLKIAVIGEKTRQSLNGYGYEARFVNPGSTAEDFTRPFACFIEHETPKPKIVLPLGNLSRTTIQRHLEKYAECTRINIYRTDFPEEINQDVKNLVRNVNFDLLIFTSPSGVHNFSQLFPDLDQQKFGVACIGETTARAAREKGFHPVVTAKHSSANGLFDSILNYYISKT